MDCSNIKTFVITVKDTGRFNILSNIYSNNSFKNVELFPVLAGNKLDITLLQKEGYYDINSFMSYKIYDYGKNRLFYGTFGCAYSHLLLYKKMLDEDIEECIITEDNVLLDKDYIEELNELFIKLKNNNIQYDIIHLHSFRKNDTGRIKLIDNIYNGNNECSGTKIYYLNKQTAKTLFINNFPIIEPSDGITCIPSRIKNYNLKSLYYEFQKISFLETKSTRDTIDNTTDQNKRVTNQISIINYTYLALVLNDKKILYKLNNQNITKKFISQINVLLQYKIIPLHYSYNLQYKNNNKLIDVFVDEITKFGTQEYKDSIQMLSLLENKKYLHLYDFIYENQNMNMFYKEKLLNIVERLKNTNYSNQFISTMIKCSNYHVSNRIDYENDKKEDYVKFGKLYIYFHGDNFFLYFSFCDNKLNDNDHFFHIGDIVINNDLTNDQIIEEFSCSIINDILFSI
jgi:GR25 family glycosyltransferase involved in LPS biosynthesis